MLAGRENRAVSALSQATGDCIVDFVHTVKIMNGNVACHRVNVLCCITS